MTDLHERFCDWLLAGATGEPPRDAALHASACDRCLADVAALDALSAIDVAGAEMPFLPVGVPRTVGGTAVRALRTLSGVAAVGLLAAAVVIGAGALREDEGGPGVAAAPTATPRGEGILGGGPSLAAIASPGLESASPSASATGDIGSSEEPAASAVAAGPTPTQPPFIAPPPPAATPGPTAAVTPRPTFGGTPLPTTAPTTPPTGTPMPTAEPTPVPTAEPTPQPTPDPTPMPTPTPEPTPECSDGIDNDGDGLIDFGLDPLVNDPDCLSPDDDEAGVLP